MALSEAKMEERIDGEHQLKRYSFAVPQLLASYTIEYYWKGMCYPGSLSKYPHPPETMWELYTKDGISFTLVYRVSAGLKMQKQECRGLGPVKVILWQLGSRTEQCIRQVAAQLRDFRATIDALAQYICFDCAALVGHYLEITPLKEVSSVSVHTRQYGN